MISGYTAGKGLNLSETDADILETFTEFFGAKELHLVFDRTDTGYADFAPVILISISRKNGQVLYARGSGRPVE